MFSFRIRFNRSITSEINEESNEIVVPIDQQRSIALRAPAADATIRTSEQLVLVGEGYASADEAAAAAETFQHALMIALARVRVGADFGRRAPKGEFTQYGLSEAGRNYGAQNTQQRPWRAHLRIGAEASICGHECAGEMGHRKRDVSDRFTPGC